MPDFLVRLQNITPDNQDIEVFAHKETGEVRVVGGLDLELYGAEACWKDHSVPFAETYRMVYSLST